MSLNPLSVTYDFTSDLMSRVLSERIESDFLLFGCDCIHSVSLTISARKLVLHVLCE